MLFFSFSFAQVTSKIFSNRAFRVGAFFAFSHLLVHLIEPAMERRRRGQDLITLPYHIIYNILHEAVELPPHIYYSCPHRNTVFQPNKHGRDSSHPGSLTHYHQSCGFGPGWSCIRPAGPPAHQFLASRLAILRTTSQLRETGLKVLMDRAFEVEIRSGRIFFLDAVDGAALQRIRELPMEWAKRIQITFWRGGSDSTPSDFPLLSPSPSPERPESQQDSEQDEERELAIVGRALVTGPRGETRILRRVDVLVVLPLLGLRHADIEGDQSLKVVEDAQMRHPPTDKEANPRPSSGGRISDEGVMKIVRWERGFSDALRQMRTVRRAHVGFSLAGTRTPGDWLGPSALEPATMWRLLPETGAHFIEFNEGRVVFRLMFGQLYRALEAQLKVGDDDEEGS